MSTNAISDELLEDTLELLNEHAGTLQALAKRLEKSDPEAAYSARAVAQELWELRKWLGGSRQTLHC